MRYPQVKDQLVEVQQIREAHFAFAATRADGTVVALAFWKRIVEGGSQNSGLSLG